MVPSRSLSDGNYDIYKFGLRGLYPMTLGSNQIVENVKAQAPMLVAQMRHKSVQRFERDVCCNK